MAEEPAMAVVPLLENAGGMAVGQVAEAATGSTAASEEGQPAGLACDRDPDGEAALAQQRLSAAPSMSLLRMEEKFSTGQYRDIGEFVADFRNMLEGCYQLYGADQSVSRQAQKLEVLLEQKLALLPRNLIDKTLAPTTSKSLSGVEEKGSECPSTRRRSSARNLANVNASTMESVMVQVLKQAEFLRAKEEKRLKEQERKEAEEANQKEMEEWDRNFLSLAAPSVMETMWEIPAIGHFLCLAQQILNLPEIVFYELERCLLMPQCNMFLSKIMTSLLCQPHRRPSLHRRPNLSYKAWESALRQKVQQWYTVVGQAENPDKSAEKLGLCSQFFKILGEMNPLEHKAFHELTFQQRVWLMKGLCDFVYETQTEVQDAVLGQPIHECREVILGYDTQENAYIHFPQFCGADVRIYKQRPLKAPEFPTPPIKIKRIPKARLNRSKCKYSKMNNGLFKSVKTVVATTTRTNVELHDDCSVDYHLDSFVSSTGSDTKPSNLQEDQAPGDNKTAYNKGNLEKPSSPGEVVGYGEPLSPGEVRILENVDKYSGLTLQKTDTSSLKENALKTFQVHVNGNHTNNTEVICHRLAMDIILDHSVLNQNMKLHKLRAKKKKKKKKMKDLFLENAQGFQHTFKAFKTDMHSKLYLNKKRVKHKKHKSGKKSLSINMVVKKKKRAAASPAIPEFQLVCTSLDELRELIKKVDGELKGLENNKKKSGKWHLRKQSVKELHGTLTRLLNELLPWEPKLLKAFQRNRARLRKDYDDFLRLPESENFTSELCSREEHEPSKSAVPALQSTEPCHKDMQQQVSQDQLQNAELEICGRGKMAKKDYISKYLSKSPTNKAIDTEDKVFLPQKKIKLSTPEISSTFTEGEMAKYAFVANSLQQMELEAAEMSKEDHGTSPLNILKGSNPIQALLAKNIGNKVTLTSQLDQSINKPVPSSGSTPSLPSTLNPMPPLKVPLQMIYKLPDGQCVPVDLQSSSVKIQMQPVMGTKSGDKLMQQVLVLPRNLFIQQKDDKTSQKTQPTPPDLTSQHSVSNMPLSSAITGQISSTPFPSPISKNILHSSSQATLSVSQPPISTIANCTLGSKFEISKSISSVLPCNFSASVLSPNVGHSFPLHSDLGRVTSSTGSVAMGSQIASPSPAQQKDITEAKQELKTVCIRDSQSILVRTRGGNTGVVKVQQNLDKGTSTPSPIFTFTPQLQSFLVSRSKPSTPSNFSPVTPLLQTSSVFSNISSTSIGLNQVTELNTKSAQAQHLTTSSATAQKICNPGQSNFLTTLSPTSTWPSTTSLATTNTVQGIVSPLSCTKSIQDCSVIKKTGSNLKLPSTTTTNISTEQPDSTTPSTPSKGDLVSGPSIHKVMLLTSPSALPSDGSTNLGLMASPTLSNTPPKKFVFINTQLPGNSSNTNVALQPLKQAASATISKTFVKPTEQQQIFLIPSTMGSPVKMCSPPIVSQVKDVKIGLTIGQTIVNPEVNKNVLPVNVLQTSLGRVDELAYKDFTVSTPAFSKVQTNDQVTSSSSVLCEHAVPTTKGSIACAVMTPVNPAQCTSTATKDKDFLRTLPSLTNLSSTANLGNTVAISTVKTGHLSSSVLLSTTQMTGHTKNVSSSLQLPVSSAFLGATSHLGATPIATAYQPTLIEHSGKTQFTSQKDRSTNIIKPQATIAPSLVSCKTGPWHVPPQTLPPLPLSTVNQVRPQLNESLPTHQKLVINTSTPLAPGTQITINGTRFIVPSQGLTAGSHVLLLTKQGPPLVGSAQMSHGSSFSNTTIPQPALAQNASLPQIPIQSFKCTNSSVLTKTLPNVQNASHIVNVTSATISQCQLPSLENPLPTTPLQPLRHCIQSGSYPLQANMTQFSRGTFIKEGALFNTVSPLGSLLPTSTVSEGKMKETEGFRYQSSATDKPHSVAT